MTDDCAITGPAAPQRLDALRAELARRGLTGFMVPRSDEHQGEYVPPSAQRLAWLTGFSGSAGAAVVLVDRAAIFVDGRYTLQVRAEVDTTRFQPLHLVEQPPTRWLGEVLAKGDRLGFDPWLHTADQVEALRLACERVGAELVACPDNPLDAVWLDRPLPPMAPVEVQDEALAGLGSIDKRRDIAAALAAEQLSALVLSAPDSIAWLLNVRGGDVAYTPLPLSFAVLHDDASVDWFIHAAKLPDGLAAHLGPDIRVRPPTDLEAELERLGRLGARVRVDAATAPARISELLAAAGARLERGADPCQLPKACKNPVELAGLRAAHRRDGAAMARFLCWLDRQAPGGQVDELMAAAALEGFRRPGENFRGLSFPTISGAGPNGAIVHYRSSPATNRHLMPGELYLVDSGAQYRDGTTDVTRTVAVGKPRPRQRRHFTLVLRGHVALARSLFPVGTTGSQLDVLARQPLWGEGLDYDHGTGHGVGSYLSVHEGPQRISKLGNSVALKPGMVLSIEPGYYKAGAYGIRIENLVAVVPVKTPAGGERALLGFETLTLAPIDRALIDTRLLTSEEIGWLDAYHARVRDEISPLVEPQVAQWLEQATRPLSPARSIPARERNRR
ncbi:X-Pro aminopeptidase [Paramagnetospirillum marisnigri]|uniref:X-Pro aminopeptidase n=1 Tax=Paramagnetospirillum marisnigri TaxID=1285242 RepID=A0A178MUE2_9PROT|nr:aminopeptidase P family protein [Paramagnetospirillum marisnigri]OAN52253.1 X-Pro aminopeptidase [Paramagnetospirillum marisnigri]